MSTTKSNNKVIGLDLYKSFWVLASVGKDENGINVDLPPIRVIPKNDGVTLREALRVVIAEPTPRGLRIPDDAIGLRARSVGAKSWPAFVRATRCFVVEVTSSRLTIEEWSRRGLSFVAANPIRRIEVELRDLKRAVDELLQRAGM